jgi:uncharacterized protein YqfA (UPF0365 family)
MELIILAVIAAGIVYAGYKYIIQEKPTLVEEVKAEIIAVEKKAEVVVAKVEEEVKAEVVAVAKKAKATATKAKAKVVEVEQEVVAAVKKARKPRAPKA